jgi:small subunit ribosomal protein S27e
MEKKISKKKEEVIKPEKTNKFIRVRCHKCGNEQVIFGRASSKVICLGKDCNEVLTMPRGGKATIKAEILEVV